METAKDTLRATVQIGYDGRVHKTYRGPKASDRFTNEIKVLRYLEEQGCPFVPKLLGFDEGELRITVSYCGTKVDHLDDARAEELFTELESYGVHHDDEAVRNVTYRQLDGRFCLIDFEFATILANHKPRHDHNVRAALGRSLRWSGFTDKGKVLEHNEDAFLAIRFDRREVSYLGRHGIDPVRSADHVFAVSDGMGGAVAGQYASWVTMEKVVHLLPSSFKLTGCGLEAGCTEVLGELYGQIHEKLSAVGGRYDECADMQAALSLCWFVPGWMYFAHAGGSRIYFLPKGSGELRRLSRDSVAGPLFDLHGETLTGGTFADPQVGTVACEVGDRFLLCTDGLFTGVDEGRLAMVLMEERTEEGFYRLADDLVEIALRTEGRDNVTAVVVEVV